MKNIIFLIGMMGTGKSSVGRELSVYLQGKFIDMDHYIEHKQHKTIAAIFEDYGEDYFRKLESEALAEVINDTQSYNQVITIIATGGGVCLAEKNRWLMSNSGYVVLLEASVEALAHRLISDNTRPLLNKAESLEQLKDKISNIYNDRKSTYDFADTKIKTDQLTVKQIVEMITEQKNRFINKQQNVFKVAIFDFDGTIYPFDTFMYLINKFKKASGFKYNYYYWIISCFPSWLLYKLKALNKANMKKTALLNFIKSFHNKSEIEIENFFEDAYIEMRELYNTTVFTELNDLRAAGYVTLLISGAVEPFIKRFADYLGIDHYVGSSLPIKNGYYDKNADIRFVQADEKVVAAYEVVDSIISSKNMIIDWEKSYAYADSYSDLQVLKLVGNPVCVNPEKKLKEFAIENNWRIIKQCDDYC